MRIILVGFVTMSMLFLYGCAGVGVTQTDDPLTKLNQADALSNQQDRPLIAERLIFEAIDIYQQRGDSHGLGLAHRAYGDLLRSPAVTGKWAVYYQKNGFYDKVTTFDNRIEKSSEYYTKALGHFSNAESKLRDEKRFDALTNLYFNMAFINTRLNQKNEACSLYDKTNAAYLENIRLNPSAQPIGNSSGSVPELIQMNKKQISCK
jgi:tetratricopeptide (TPR) repeat protein